jgi:rifampin ADP-ribosylating transferase
MHVNDAPDRETYYHGTRADLKAGDVLAPGYRSHYGSNKTNPWIYFAARLEAAIWGAELAGGDGAERIYIVEPTGPFEDDPNLTDKKFPGNPTRSFRSREPLKIVGEIRGWIGHPAEDLQRMKESVERLRAQGIEAID